MKKIYAVVLVLISLMLFTACGGDKWQESYDLGMRYLSEGNYAEAIIAFDKAIKIDPKQPMAYIGRANAHIGSGETDDNLAVAFADYTVAIELDETNANAWLGLADVYIRQGEFDKARETLQEALVKTNNADIIANKLAEIEAGNIKDSSGNIRRMNGYDKNGNLVWYHIYSYDEKGWSNAITSYDSQNQQTGHVDMEYDPENRRSVGYNYDMETGEIEKTEMIHDENGNIVKNIMDDGFEIHYEYDEQGNKTKEIYYDNGILYRYSTMEYIDNLLIKEINYSDKGECWGYYTYEYNGDGKRIKQVHYDENGRISAYWTLLYDENGRMISEKSYDGNGNLLMSTVSE